MAGFGAQNWLITPAPRAFWEAPPANARGQKWLMVLTGVIFLDLTGTKANDWTRKTIGLQPGIGDPLQHAIATHGVPKPAGTAGQQWFATFQVDQIAPFAALGSIFNHGSSVHAGYAVDGWSARQFASGTDAFSGAPLKKLYAGIHLDLAVRNKAAVIHRVGYHISMLGQIVFAKLGTGAAASGAAAGILEGLIES